MVGVKMLPTLAMVNASWYDMPEMGDDASGNEQLSLCVVVNSPRIAKAVSYDFENVFGRVVAPYPSVYFLSVLNFSFIGIRFFALIYFPFSDGLSDCRRGGKSLCTIQPTVRSPV